MDNPSLTLTDQARLAALALGSVMSVFGIYKSLTMREQKGRAR